MVDSSQPGLTLHWALASQPSRSVKAVLDIGKVEHTVKNYNVLAGETKTEEFLKLNPAGKVPFIVEGDFSLGESNAILKHLVDTKEQIPESLWPKDAHKRALVDQQLVWWDSHFRPTVLAPFLNRIMVALGRAELSTDATPVQKANIEQTLQTLDDLLAKQTGDFVTGSDLTIADLQLFFEFTDLTAMRYKTEKYVNVNKWLEAVSAVPAVKAIQDQWAEFIGAFIGKVDFE